jgi:TolB-like protein
MSDVFISYARSTAKQAQEVAEALRSLGYSIWWDDDLPSHRAYADVIEEQLNSARAVVVIWSAEAVKSQWVRSEANRAREDGKLVQLSVDNANLPMPFDQIHCADLSAWSGNAENPEWRAVLSSVSALAGDESAAGAAAASDSQSTRKPSKLSDVPKPGERPALALPAKPSIAVLSFSSPGDDPDDEYFVDAISEDIVTALSRWHWFFVIASNSSFTYKGRDIDASRIGRELGVRYVLEGSVRKIANRVRVTAQLVDVSDGSHVWAERFDRELVDILALQDAITEQVVAAIEPAMLQSEGARVVRKSVTDYTALDCFHRGMWQLNRVSKEGYAAAIALFEETIRRDPELALGHLGLARILYGGAVFGWSTQPIADLQAARSSAHTAIRLDPRDAWGYYAGSGASLYLGDHGAALNEARKAIDLNPNFASAQVRLGQVLIFSGRPTEAIAPLERAVRLSPYDPQLGMTLDLLALAYYQDANYEQAIVEATAAVHQSHSDGSIVLAASLAQLGRIDQAAKALPSARWDNASPLRPRIAPYADPGQLEHLRQGVRLARALVRS